LHTSANEWIDKGQLEILILILTSQWKINLQHNAKLLSARCLMKEKLVKLSMPKLAESHMAHKKRVWEYRMGELMKTVKVLEGNLCNIFAVLLSLYDSDVKNQVESNMNFGELEKNLNSTSLL